MTDGHKKNESQVSDDELLAPVFFLYSFLFIINTLINDHNWLR